MLQKDLIFLIPRHSTLMTDVMCAFETSVLVC